METVNAYSDLVLLGSGLVVGVDGRLEAYARGLTARTGLVTLLETLDVMDEPMLRKLLSPPNQLKVSSRRCRSSLTSIGRVSILHLVSPALFRSFTEISLPAAGKVFRTDSNILTLRSNDMILSLA